MVGDCTPVQACSQAVRHSNSSNVDSSSPQSSSPGSLSPEMRPSEMEECPAQGPFKTACQQETSFPGGFPMPYYITKKHGGLPLPLRKTDCSPIEGFVWFRHRCYPVGALVRATDSPAPPASRVDEEQLDWIVGLDGERRLGIALSDTENAEESSFPMPHYLLADEQFYPMAYDEDGIPLEGTVRHPNNTDILVPVGLQVFQNDSDQADCLTSDERLATRPNLPSLPRPVAGVIRMIDGKKCFGVPVHELAGWSTHYTQKAEQDDGSVSDASQCPTPKTALGRVAQTDEAVGSSKLVLDEIANNKSDDSANKESFPKSIIHRIASTESVNKDADVDADFCVNFTEGVLKSGSPSGDARDLGTRSVASGSGTLLSLTTSFLPNLPRAPPLVAPPGKDCTDDIHRGQHLPVSSALITGDERVPPSHRRALSSYVSSLTRILAGSPGPGALTGPRTPPSQSQGSINPMFSSLLAGENRLGGGVLTDPMAARKNAIQFKQPEVEKTAVDASHHNFLYQLSKQQHQQQQPLFPYTPELQKIQPNRQVCEEHLGNQTHQGIPPRREAYRSQAPLAAPSSRPITGGQESFGPPVTQQIRMEANQQHWPFPIKSSPPKFYPALPQSNFTGPPTPPPNCFAFFTRPQSIIAPTFTYSPIQQQHINLPPSHSYHSPIPLPPSPPTRTFQASPLTRVFTDPPPAGAPRSFTQPPAGAPCSFGSFVQPAAGVPRSFGSFVQPAAGVPRSFGSFAQPPVGAPRSFAQPLAVGSRSLSKPPTAPPDWSQVNTSTKYYAPSWTTPNNFVSHTQYGSPLRISERVSTMPGLRTLPSCPPATSSVAQAPTFQLRGYPSPNPPCSSPFPPPRSLYPSTDEWQSSRTYDARLLQSSATAGTPTAITQSKMNSGSPVNFRMRDCERIPSERPAVVGPRGEFVPPANGAVGEDGSDALLTPDLAREEWVVLDERNREGRSRSRSANGGLAVDGFVKEKGDGLCGGGESFTSSSSYRRNVHHVSSKRFPSKESSSFSLPWYCLCGANTAEKRKSSQKSVR